MRRTLIAISAAALVLVGCENNTKPPESMAETKTNSSSAAPDTQAISTQLDAILATRSDELKARYPYRHPKETLLFFGIKPGMVLGEVGPGDGVWYTQILAPLLGVDGAIYAINYDDNMWSHFGRFNDEQIADRIDRSRRFAGQVAQIKGADGITAKGFPLNKVPEELYGTMDAILSIRELHNPAAYEDEGQFLTNAIAEFNKLLKPGGILGVVQHRASEDADPKWANGSMGYQKQSDVINAIEAAGFKLEATSEINANPKDNPETFEYVWRLPPVSIHLTDELKAKKDEYLAIGESDRMTLKFVKVN